ncbi:CsbD family protein [Schumannella sp. 10F1B-5-1]|uniref:CsbD family protein n=1 Tax=Schumannella sp. 10F1B-5-1 TaxID=2590780 RepID=UPI00112FF2D0|nr:CsbD family protein [Schumannella sp. 10F1B-5-1]TPW78377.1 CsbD family protein [Schumannella sp. 10F1B-5-1]
MALSDDIKNTAQKIGGQAKEAVGAATGNDRLKAEGQVDQASAGAKKVVSDVKDKLTGKN